MFEMAREDVLFSHRLPNGGALRVVDAATLSNATLGQMLEVLTVAFGRWPAFDLPVPPIEHLRWKLEGPPGVLTTASLVELDGRLASMSTTVRFLTRVLDETQLFEAGGDTATHPDFERRGMYAQRVAFEEQTIDTWVDGSLSVSLNPTVLNRRSRDARSQPPVNNLRVLARIYNPSRVAADRREAGARVPAPLLALGMAPLAVGATMAGLLWPRPRGLTVRVVQQFDERFDRLFEESAREFDLIRVRSSDYLNWRFADPRGGSYTSLAVEEGDELLGYAVYRMSGDRGYISDLFVRPGRIDAADVLVRAMEVAFRHASAAVAIVWLPGVHPYRALLRRRGFIDSRQPTGLSLRTTPRVGVRAVPRAVFEDPRARIHATIGDTDII
jgi:hypothetical protein